ncbi:MaoC family dehydratase [Luteimonas aquatica]|uniref:MaoC family dehydratase n=1 Tax=Luteimonas aquatica TaxID=450364 RepID=UPI001F5A4793|nr:MaoC/PaaZ C-terminal domain-containing protein [Luteimonas aquatica]
MSPAHGQPFTGTEFAHPPSLLRSYLRAALARRPAPDGMTIVPPIALRLRGARAGADRLRRYRAVCGFAEDGQLPLPYPQVLAAPLHLALVTHPAFPFRPAGIVHLRNCFARHAPLPEDIALDLQVRTDGYRIVGSGIEFDLVTEARDAHGAMLWESVTTSLVRLAQRARAPAPRAAPDYRGYRLLEQWPVPADTGRRYARASGDWNPIHLHALGAKPLGFPRAIAHGMWSFARCLAAVERIAAPQPRWHVAFKRPLLLPGDAQLHLRQAQAHPGPERLQLLLSDRSGATLYLAAETPD